jgi:hypothetical protein
MLIINDYCSFLLGHEKAGSTHSRKGSRSRFPEDEMSASGSNDIHPEALKIDAQAQPPTAEARERGEPRAKMHCPPTPIASFVFSYGAKRK